MSIEQKITLRVEELKIERDNKFRLSNDPKIHILMKTHYRTAANEDTRVIVELENLLRG